jgi:hypothetical protein
MISISFGGERACRAWRDLPSGFGAVQKGQSAMLWRHPCLVRAGLAAGLVTGILAIGASSAAAQNFPSPTPDAEPSSVPVAVATETVDILEGRGRGDLDVVAHGHGQDRVRLTIQNRSKRRLNVVVPPGLVAASALAQGPGGAGGRLQSIGLGSLANRSGAFGEFRETTVAGGLQSVDLLDPSPSRSVAVPVGETIDVTIPGVCLNYGLPSPTPRNTLRLMSVDDYSSNPLVRKALRSLSTYGTTLGVAQAVMWRVCNDLSFELMSEQTGKVMNLYEIALAARFVEALEASSAGELVDPSALSQSRVFIQLRGEKNLAADARRLSGQLEGLRILGMPVQVVDSEAQPAVAAPALLINLALTEAKTGETHGRLVVSSCAVPDAWLPLGKLAFRDNSSVSVLDGTALARAIDRAISSTFVTVKPARRTQGNTTLKIENRLPFTLSRLVVKAGTSSGSPSVAYEGVGVGPARSVLVPIQAATASLVEHVELNGL